MKSIWTSSFFFALHRCDLTGDSPACLTVDWFGVVSEVEESSEAIFFYDRAEEALANARSPKL